MLLTKFQRIKRKSESLQTNLIADSYPINLQKYAWNDTYRESRQLTPERQISSDNETIELVDGFIGASKALRQTIQSVTKIDIGIQSQLLVSPGAQVEIIYEITNLRTEPQYYTFLVQDELRYLRSMEPKGYIFKLY